MDLPLSRRPDAIAAFNDVMAIGAMRAIQSCGASVGSDVAVTGFDDAPMTQYLAPPLTTVRQPIWRVGQRVISMLLSQLDGEPPGALQELLPPQLIVRQSCGAHA
jgi:LacI family transcriptional regulator